MRNPIATIELFVDADVLYGGQAATVTDMQHRSIPLVSGARVDVFDVTRDTVSVEADDRTTFQAMLPDCGHVADGEQASGMDDHGTLLCTDCDLEWSYFIDMEVDRMREERIA